MGFLPNLRTGSNQEDLPNSSGSSPINNSKKRWVNFMPLFVTLVVIAEIALLGRLDISENAALVNSWADSFYQFTSSSPAVGGDEVGFGELDFDRSSESETCEQWLEREDSVVYSRDFHKEPISVTGGEQEFKSCAVGCKFGSNRDKKPDAAFGLTQQSGTARVLRSMESSHYYPANNIARARGRGFDIIMTTSLSSNVPVGYFSWAEYDFMAPLQPKTERALAAAFISNCGARNLRLQTLEALEKAHVDIDSYGGCHRNRDGNVNKVDALKRYKFSLAFENSNEEDYVTEKFFQSLVAGSVPVVVGAPNIQDFAPSHDSVLHIRELQDVDSVAKTMKYLAENPGAYNQSLRWKFEGPSDSFKALVDMAAVHSSCRLCIYLATMAHEKEEKSAGFPKRPCKCMRGLETVYHIYVRERGRFQMESIFLRLSNLTMEAMESAVILKFRSRKHIPVWKQERPESIRGGDELKVYRIYPLGKTQRQALYTFRFKSDGDLRSHIESNPCAKFEVIFV